VISITPVLLDWANSWWTAEGPSALLFPERRQLFQ
jgi:hypothetical protein